MPEPKEVFDNPEKYWQFLTVSNDSKFEGQHFERKEAGRPDNSGNVSPSKIDNITDKITASISAFANTNRNGGLFVLGISSQG